MSDQSVSKHASFACNTGNNLQFPTPPSPLPPHMLMAGGAWPGAMCWPFMGLGPWAHMNAGNHHPGPTVGASVAPGASPFMLSPAGLPPYLGFGPLGMSYFPAPGASAGAMELPPPNYHGPMIAAPGPSPHMLPGAPHGDSAEYSRRSDSPDSPQSCPSGSPVGGMTSSTGPARRRAVSFPASMHGNHSSALGVLRRDALADLASKAARPGGKQVVSWLEREREANRITARRHRERERQARVDLLQRLTTLADDNARLIATARVLSERRASLVMRVRAATAPTTLTKMVSATGGSDADSVEA